MNLADALNQPAATPLAAGTRLPVARYRFTFRMREPLLLPWYAGSLLRGGFGATLRRTACMTGAKDLHDLSAACHLPLSGDLRRVGAGIGRFAEGEPRAQPLCRPAAVPRTEVVFGWDLARWHNPSAPSASRPQVASTGSLSMKASPPEYLRKLAARALWPGSGEDASRGAEGFNCVALSGWPPGDTP